MLIKFTLNDQNSNDVDVINLLSSNNKTATIEQIVKKSVQAFLGACSTILHTKGSSVAKLKHYCLDYVFFEPKFIYNVIMSQLIYNVP